MASNVLTCSHLELILLIIPIPSLLSIRTTNQVLSQLKILVTALFAVLLLKTHLSWTKWFSLVVLVAGVALVQVSGLKEDNQEHNNSNMIGFVCVVLCCILSGFAGVYFEKVLKGSDVSIWVRNVELALIGIILGLWGVWYQDAEAVIEHGFFHGYREIVWAVIGLQACGGILVSLVIRYADNLLKGKDHPHISLMLFSLMRVSSPGCTYLPPCVFSTPLSVVILALSYFLSFFSSGFATSIAIILSCLVSYAFLGEFNLSFKFLIGLVLVILSVMMYNINFGETKAISSPARMSNNKQQDDEESVPLQTVYDDEGNDEPRRSITWNHTTSISPGARRSRAQPA